MSSNQSVFNIMLLSLLFSGLQVSGDYVVQVTVHSYSTLTNRAEGLSGGCCDGDTNSDGTCTDSERCDTFFTYCLRALNTNTFNRYCDGFILNSTNNTDGELIDFTQPIVLELPNPLTLPGLTNVWQGVQLYVEVTDLDTAVNNPDDLVNAFAFNVQSNQLNSALTRVTAGVYRYSTISLTIETRCAEFYTGDECEQSIHCIDRDCTGRGMCQGEGSTYKCVCDPGYNGTDCEQDIDECSLLPQPVCNGRGNCSHGIDYFNCSCEPGFTGVVCEVEVDECVGVTCNGRGSCNDELNGFECDCFPGYTGSECEDDIDECQGQRCSGNGQCVNLVGSFVCECGIGFTGSLCELEIDDCDGVNCSGNGQCVDGSCVCDSGYMGRQCSTRVLTLMERAGDIAGGVVGALLGLALLIVLVLLVIILVTKKAQHKVQQTRELGSQCMPGDNPTYGMVPPPPQMTTTMTSQTAEFDNPIYGSNRSLNDAELYSSPYEGSDFTSPIPAYTTPVYDTCEQNSTETEELYQNV